jgi:hypothetical protein
MLLSFETKRMAWKIAYQCHSRGSRGNLRHPSQLRPRVSGWGYTCSQTVQLLVTFTRIEDESFLSSFFHLIIFLRMINVGCRVWLKVQFYLSPLKSKHYVRHQVISEKGTYYFPVKQWYVAIWNNCQGYLANGLIPHTVPRLPGRAGPTWYGNRQGMPHLC